MNTTKHKIEASDKAISAHLRDFMIWRNVIGALLLLPNGTNQSFSSDKYIENLKHYIKENTYAQTLNHNYYEKNPNLLKSAELRTINFRPHNEFKKNDIIERNKVVEQLCEKNWDLDIFRTLN